MLVQFNPLLLNTSTFVQSVSDADAYYFSDGTFITADPSVTNRTVSHMWDCKNVNNGYFVVLLYTAVNFNCTIRNWGNSYYRPDCIICGTPSSIDTVQSMCNSIIMVNDVESCNIYLK